MLIRNPFSIKIEQELEARFGVLPTNSDALKSLREELKIGRMSLFFTALTTIASFAIMVMQAHLGMLVACLFLVAVFVSALVCLDHLSDWKRCTLELNEVDAFVLIENELDQSGDCMEMHQFARLLEAQNGHLFAFQAHALSKSIKQRIRTRKLDALKKTAQEPCS